MMPTTAQALGEPTWPNYTAKPSATRWPVPPARPAPEGS
jgi:hypothetical protein